MQQTVAKHAGWIMLAVPQNDMLDALVRFISEREPKLLQELSHLVQENAGIPGSTFYIEASEETVELIKHIPWVRSIYPHPNQFRSYEVRVTDQVRLLGTYIKGLKLLLSEHLLQNEAKRITQRPGRFYVQCTERVAKFISQLSGIEKVIQRT